jgi:hypothetical protein
MPLRPRIATQIKPQGQTIPIKRVIRLNGMFVCGVCRRARGDEASAAACLERCLANWLGSAPPVNEVKDGAAGPKQFRCGFCKRVYTKRNEAQACADACRNQTKQAVEAERKLSPVRAAATAPAAAPAAAKKPAAARKPTPVPAPEKERKSQKPKFGREHMHKFLRDGRKLICRKCGKESPTMEAVIACYDADEKAPKPKVERVQKSEDQAVFAPVPAPTAKTLEDEAAAARIRGAQPVADEASMFFRDGARYVCRHCSAKFFTKGDVVACYKSHVATG